MKEGASVLSETGDLESVVVKRPDEAFVETSAIATQWRALGYTSPPNLDAARAEHARLVDALQSAGATVYPLPSDTGTGLDSIYVRDASIVCRDGVILGSMAKLERRGEPAAQARALADLGAPHATVVGAISGEGRLDGGDLVWLDSRTVAVGRGYRTNADGIEQLRTLLDDSIDELIVVPLPHWRGPGDVLHLMSLLSPVDANLAVVYSPLLPVPFREQLLQRGIELVEVPESEFESMGANVLAVAPRRCIMLDGNPRTRSALERAGTEVTVYSGIEISLKGSGGPTCLTRPLVRRAPAL
jgi:N-dimethylarginine dimethylaminohydrolase